MVGHFKLDFLVLPPMFNLLVKKKYHILSFPIHIMERHSKRTNERLHDALGFMTAELAYFHCIPKYISVASYLVPSCLEEFVQNQAIDLWTNY